MAGLLRPAVPTARSLLESALPATVEAKAQMLAAQWIARAPTPSATGERTYVAIDPESLALTQPRSVGVEQVALHAWAELKLEALLTSLGVNAITRGLILAQVVARMAAPGSDRAAWTWLAETSALDELIGRSWAEISIQRFYRAAEVLLRHHTAIEAAVYGRVQDLFGWDATVTLYDLTNTYFEGRATGNTQAKRGRSKEKRSDCPLLTLGLVLDGNGFVRRSRVLAGNAVECRTLEGMLTDLGAPVGALVVMDRGIATAVNLTWLREQGYRYLVVSRERSRVMPTGDLTLTTASGDSVQIMKVIDVAAQEGRLYCHTPAREAKETAIGQRLTQRFEAGLMHLAEGLKTARGEKRPDRIQERLGRLKARCGGIAQHYDIQLTLADDQTQVTDLTWTRQPLAGTRLTDPGIYCLRSSDLSLDEEALWRSYRMLTDLESVFRSLKSELGLRPIYHSKERRCDAHLFISVLAYQCVQLIRRQLQTKGIQDSWATLRQILSVQRRVTVTFTCQDGRTLHLRKATRPEPKLLALYQALGLDPLPGAVKRLVV